MHRRAFLALAVVCCLAAPAMGTVTVTAGNHDLLPNTPGQVVQVVLSSDVPQGVQSADLGLGIIDIDGGVVQGTPMMTAIDMTSAGTLFGDAPSGNTGQTDFEAFPTINQLSSLATTEGDTVPAAGGVLANVTIDTTGLFTPETFTFDLNYSPFFLPTSTSSIPGQGTDILVNGTLNIIPEPSSILLGLFAAAGLAVVGIRRRKGRRSA